MSTSGERGRGVRGSGLRRTKPKLKLKHYSAKRYKKKPPISERLNFCLYQVKFCLYLS